MADEPLSLPHLAQMAENDELAPGYVIDLPGLNERGALLTMPLADGRVADIYLEICGTGLLTISDSMQASGWRLGWQYQTPLLAALSLGEWIAGGMQSEPQGWHREPGTGRRRPGGDPEKEFSRL